MVEDDTARPLAKPRSDSDKPFPETLEGHELAQLRRMAQLTMVEKIAWLEDAQRMVVHMLRHRVAQGLPIDERYRHLVTEAE